MARKREEIKPTIVGRLYLESPVDKAKLLHLMRKFRDAIEMAHYHMRQGRDINEIHRRLTRFLDNGHYAHSAYQRAKLYKNQPYLKLRKPQLFSVGRACEKGNRNIRLSSTERVKIKIPHADGKHEWIEIKVKFGQKYLPLIEEIVKLANDNKLSYGATIVYNKKKYHLHLHIPLELYAKYLEPKVKVKARSHLIASFDLNVDRINMVIVDSEGKIRDIKTEFFPKVISHGVSKEKAETIRLQALSKLIDYACCHNVKYFVFEKLQNIDESKLHNRVARSKVGRFPFKDLLQHAKIMVKKRNGKFITINPAWLSIDTIPLSRKLGLDTHTTSAYLLAIRYIRNRRTKRNKN